MTTPQSALYNISYKMDRLMDVLMSTEENTGLLEIVERTGDDVEKLKEQMATLQDQMNLIIKLLGNCNDKIM